MPITAPKRMGRIAAETTVPVVNSNTSKSWKYWVSASERKQPDVHADEHDDRQQAAEQALHHALEMNGTRMNQLVAPTSFITSISRRRANMAVRIVLKIRSTATAALMSEAHSTPRLSFCESSWMARMTSVALSTSQHPWLAFVDAAERDDGLHVGVGGLDAERGGEVALAEQPEHGRLVLEQLLDLGEGLLAVDVGEVADLRVLLEGGLDRGLLLVGDLGLEEDRGTRRRP